MPLDASEFRRAMGQLVTGVTVVTTRDPAGRPLGMTASAVASLSLRPPMVLVCVDRQAEIHRPLLAARHFGINVLAAGQVELARDFALKEAKSWDGLGMTDSPQGVPRLPGVLAFLECRREDVHQGGDHSIVTGTVQWGTTGPGNPLCYFGGTYAELPG